VVSDKIINVPLFIIALTVSTVGSRGSFLYLPIALAALKNNLWSEELLKKNYSFFV
jgi:hypothetical protein